MDLFGLLLAKSLLGLIPKEEVGEDKYVKLNDAFLVFFKQNFYWLKFGYDLFMENTIYMMLKWIMLTDLVSLFKFQLTNLSLIIVTGRCFIYCKIIM